MHVKITIFTVQIFTDSYLLFFFVTFWYRGKYWDNSKWFGWDIRGIEIWIKGEWRICAWKGIRRRCIAGKEEDDHIWSNVKNYRFQETKEPFRCCGKENCVSLSERVNKLLDPDILEIQIGIRHRDRMDNSELKPESFRFVAYRNLFILTYGRTRAKMERKPLPSCLVMRVRSQFPDPDNQYTGFKAKRKRRLWVRIQFVLLQIKDSRNGIQRRGRIFWRILIIHGGWPAAMR